MKPVPQSNPFASHLAYVQSQQSEDWAYAPLAGELHRWIDILNYELGLAIPRPILHFMPIRNAYATYEWLRGQIGTPDNITLNTLTLDRPAAYIVRTLAHEMLHLWQQYHGSPTQKRNWHNDEYIEKAKSCGILIDQQGCTSGHTELFADLVAKHGIDLPDVHEVEVGILIPPTGGIEPKVYGTRAKNGGGSHMKKWTCGCTIVRCAVLLTANCWSCGKPFLKED